MNKKYLGLVGLGAFGVAMALTSSAILPSGVGTYSAWTPSTGTTHYTLVDESACNGTTDYVSTAVNGNRDSYAVSLASIPNGSVITGVSLTPCASKSATSGIANMSVFYRLNGVNSADSATYSLSGTKPVNLAATNYSGLSVTKNASTTLEAGAVLVSGTQGARLSRLATVITYTSIPNPPAGVTATATSSTSIIVQWFDTNSDELGYSIDRSTDGVNFSFLATTTANATSYLDGGLSTGTYYYKVRAFNAVGYSGYATTASAMIP